MMMLSVGASCLPGWAEELLELVGEGVGGGPAEVVGDGYGVVAAAKPDGPDPFGGSSVGTVVGVVDLDGDGLGRVFL
jgi:hypothetical protein